MVYWVLCFNPVKLTLPAETDILVPAPKAGPLPYVAASTMSALSPPVTVRVAVALLLGVVLVHVPAVVVTVAPRIGWVLTVNVNGSPVLIQVASLVLWQAA